MDKVSGIYKELENKDFSFLKGIEKGMKKRQWVPEDELSYLSGLHPKETKYRLNRLKDLDLIKRRGDGDCSLTVDGYDSLAINVLVENNTISEISSQVDAGKESEIYKGKNDEEKEFIIKVHREEYSDFRDLNRKRQYSGNWREISQEAAKREFKILNQLEGEVSVPKPIDYNRHTLVIELFEGIELSKARVDNPGLVFDTIIKEISKTWKEGFVHADMSEYNILISEENMLIIDWPQSVKIDHPNAVRILKRDISNILSQFRKKYPDEKFGDEKKIVEEIVGQ